MLFGFTLDPQIPRKTLACCHKVATVIIRVAPCAILPRLFTARIPDSISALKCLNVLAETSNHGPSADPIPRGELISDSLPGGSDETSKMHEGTLSIKHHLTR
jgi:hypothetical protein